MKPSIVILTGEKAGTKIPLQANVPMTFGRDPSTEIHLPEKKVSRKHAAIRWIGNANKVELEDLNSLNGTFVNGEQIHGRVYLHHKDRIQVGSFLMEYQDPDSESSIFELNPQKSDIRATGPISRDSWESSLASDIPIKQTPQTGGRLIAGRIEELSLPDLLQMLATTRKSGHLVVSTDRIEGLNETLSRPKGKVASLLIYKGDVISARLGDLEKEDAFYKLIGWRSGFFALFPHHDFSIPDPMQIPLEALLLDAMRVMDEERLHKTKLTADTRFEIRLDEPMTSLEPDELRVFQLALKDSVMQSIWKSSPFDETRTNEIIKSLLAKSFLLRRD